MLRKIFFPIFIALVIFNVSCNATPPKLIVVISIDQMPFDYLTRFKKHFGADGFEYLTRTGANFTNATFKHSLTMTGPGHAVLLSGSYGNENGIISNDWYNIQSHSGVYCVADPGSKTVGATSDPMAIANFLGSTFGDELRRASGASKVISVSHKDRSAILMGGRNPTGVYWMVDSQFVTSTYYSQTLPEWVSSFNSSGKINSYFGKMWERVLPASSYAEMDIDDAPYENGANGLGRTFPHPITGNDRTLLTNSYYYAMLSSPFGNEILSEFAKRAIISESLGKRGITDLLCVGFSSNDYCGHAFGPNSHEVMDITVQTDRVLADFLSFLDTTLGLENCLLVLTSDHGVMPIPEYLKNQNPKADAGRVKPTVIEEFCNTTLSTRYGIPKDGMKWIEKLISGNIYLNRATLVSMGVRIDEAATVLADSLPGYNNVAVAFTESQLIALKPTSILERRIKSSFHQGRSGDLFFVLRPYYLLSSGNSGTSHGAPYDYDAHVPVIFSGKEFRAGTYTNEASPVDIGPTLSALLQMRAPAGRAGRILKEAFVTP